MSLPPKPRKLLLHERVLILLDEIDRADGYNCETIASELKRRTYAGDHTINAAAINAAMSGISQRARCRNYVTDGKHSANDQRWKDRKWRLAPDGRARVVEVRKEMATGLAV